MRRLWVRQRREQEALSAHLLQYLLQLQMQILREGCEMLLERVEEDS